MKVPFRAAAGMLLATMACGGSETVAPRPSQPARLTVTTAPLAAVTVGGAAGSMTVRVTDEENAPVSGVIVRFAAGSLVAVAPDSARTDAAGEARTVVTAGTKSGAATISASAGGSDLSAQVTLVVVAGPAVQIVVTPKSARVFYVGDTVQLGAVALDQYDNRLSSGALTFTVADPTLLRADPGGRLTALRQDGVSTVIVSNGTHSDSAIITVTPAGVTPCTGVAPRREPAVGAIATFSGVSSGCLGGGANGAEYALVVFNGTLDGSASLSATLVPTGIAAAPTAPIDAVAMLGTSPTPAFARGSRTAALVPDETFHLRLHERAGATVRAHAAGARRWFAARPRDSAAITRERAGIVPSYSAIPASPAVGDLMRVNVNASQDCTAPDYRGVRVRALGARTIVLADTLNPANGFTSADYDRYAARFDTLVYPLDAGAFGAPTDIDGNGRVAILFTRAVNELTPAGSSSFVAGFFYGRDLLPAAGAGSCAASNEGELLYMLVPDPDGEVNGNERRAGFVDTITTAVLAHELQHLINSSRRLYVNQGAATEEAVWLNEGLSHIAEELLYFRESGKAMRANLGDDAVRVRSADSYGFFTADLGANFARLAEYLRNPGGSSPTAADDELATRGATWSFLRYAVDQVYAADGDVWARFDNSTTTGLSTLRSVFGAADLRALFRDWAVANLVDDAGLAPETRFTHPTWNFRSLFGATFGSYDASHTVFTPIGSPLRVASLTNGVNARARVRGASASYYRLAVAGGREALLGFGTETAPVDPALEFILVRTR